MNSSRRIFALIRYVDANPWHHSRDPSCANHWCQHSLLKNAPAEGKKLFRLRSSKQISRELLCSSERTFFAKQFCNLSNWHLALKHRNNMESGAATYTRLGLLRFINRSPSGNAKLLFRFFNSETVNSVHSLCMYLISESSVVYCTDYFGSWRRWRAEVTHNAICVSSIGNWQAKDPTVYQFYPVHHKDSQFFD